jgi:hypothetical protein
VIARRQLLAALLGGLGQAACAPRVASSPAGAEEPRLSLDPVVDLVPAAGLGWLVDTRPRDILAVPTLEALLVAAIPDDRLDLFAARHGFDLRLADEVAVASTGPSTMGVARLRVDLPRIEAAFAKRARAVEGRAVDRGVTRFWGAVGDEREQVAVFGTGAVGIERGSLGPLRSAVYFAEGRLRRSLPALAASPLADAAALLGPAPLRFFAPGPFEGDTAGAFGGLLGASTAVAAALGTDAAAAGPTATPAASGALRLRLVLTGAWGVDAPAAGDRLLAVFRALAVDPIARLSGLDQPVGGPVVVPSSGALALDVSLDPVRMVAGVRAAMGAPTAEIMAF